MYFKGQGGNNFLFGIKRACAVLYCAGRTVHPHVEAWSCKGTPKTRGVTLLQIGG